MRTAFFYRRIHRFLVAFMLFWGTLSVAVTWASPHSFPDSIQFIYIDANVGSSSGGHTALRLGEMVYHFQVFPDGLSRLVRDRWTYFRYIYNDLENRTLHLADISVDAKTLQRIQHRLNRYYLIQEAHMERLKALQADETLLSNLGRGKNNIVVKGVGLFAREPIPSSWARTLRSAIVLAHGKNFLEQGIQNLDQELAILSIDLTIPKAMRISNTTYPPKIFSIHNTYQLNRLKHASLSVIQDARSVNEDGLKDPGALVPANAPSNLTFNERMLLEAFSRKLLATVVKLAVSKRPDWGYPLLLATARYHAVCRSLEENKLILLDAFPADAHIVSDKNQQEDPLVMAELSNQSLKTYLDIRKASFSKSVLDERSYNLLEESGGRYVELQNGQQTGGKVRVAYGRLIPSAPGPVPLSVKSGGQANIGPQAYIRFARKIYQQQLKISYPYDLITENCATQLLGLINDAFDSQDDIRQGLGGYIRPGEPFSYIPFRLHGLILEHFRIQQTSVLPAYRKRMVAQMYTRETNAIVYFREFNTLSSSVYKHLSEDTPFLFFTDDVVWPRPLYGAANTVYGGLISAAGLLTLPLDKGTLSGKGLRGMLFSLPELFFFNIRKGSFNYVSDADDPRTETLERSAPAFNRYVSP